MKQNLTLKRATECIESWDLLEDLQKIIQTFPQQEIIHSQFISQIDRHQNQRKVLCSIQEKDIAKLVKKRKKNVWTESENQNLIRLHDQLGNKWSAISKKFPGKTENDVKNRFFSQLRMGLRYLNKKAAQLMGKKFQQIKPSVLYKIISSCEEEPIRQTQLSLSVKQLSKQLKMELFDFLMKNNLKKSFQVYELVKKIRLFIAFKNPHIKTKKQRIEQNCIAISHQQSSDDSASLVEQTKKEYLCPKIKQMKTMQESQDEPHLNQLGLQQLQTSLNEKFIQKPSICLCNPFEQPSFWIPQQENSWNIDQHSDQSSFMAVCYQELIFPNNQSLL